MKDKISELIRLQDCDNSIREIIDKRNEGPLKIKMLEDELNTVEGKFQEDSNRLESLKRDSRAVDQQLQDLEDKIFRSSEKLTHVKSNREYKAALKEIDDLKKSKFLTEEKAIQIMEEVEELEERCVINKQQQGALRKKFEKDRDDILKDLEALDEQLKTLEKKRIDFSQAIDQDLLKKYLYLNERREGQAISPVIRGVCQICHMGIPPQKFNELIKGDSLLTCPNCSRIIYWAEDEHFQEPLTKA